MEAGSKMCIELIGTILLIALTRQMRLYYLKCST